MPYSKRQLEKLLLPDMLPAKRVKHTAQRVAETVIKQKTFQVEDTAVTEQLRLYRAAFEDIRNAALTAQEQMGMSPATRDRVVAFVRDRLSTLTDDVAATALRAATAAHLGGYYGRLWLLDMTTRSDVAINTPRVEAVMNVLREDVYDQLIRDMLGREWRETYAIELDDLVNRIRRSLGNSLINGEGMDEAMRQVADAMGVTTDRRRGPIGSAQRAGYRANFNRVQTLTRTVIQTQSNRGAINAYEANADILSGYEWLTARDERVCPQCRGLDGTIHKFGSKFQPPAHPNCRCTVIPVLKPADMGPLDEPPRETFETWARGIGMESELAAFLVGRAA